MSENIPDGLDTSQTPVNLAKASNSLDYHRVKIKGLGPGESVEIKFKEQDEGPRKPIDAVINEAFGKDLDTSQLQIAVGAINAIDVNGNPNGNRLQVVTITKKQVTDAIAA